MITTSRRSPFPPACPGLVHDQCKLGDLKLPSADFGAIDWVDTFFFASDQDQGGSGREEGGQYWLRQSKWGQNWLVKIPWRRSPGSRRWVLFPLCNWRRIDNSLWFYRLAGGEWFQSRPPPLSSLPCQFSGGGIALSFSLGLSAVRLIHLDLLRHRYPYPYTANNCFVTPPPPRPPHLLATLSRWWKNSMLILTHRHDEKRFLYRFSERIILPHPHYDTLVA